ncbi:MAG: hypothetical protein LBR45_04910 [Bacteroidales bacterium]|jgi:hypothetical protein|nr:hypothetical protein [Bacteroidales bacterium]
MERKILVLMLLSIAVGFAIAQQIIPIKGKIEDGKVYLRWAAPDVATWRKAQQNGFLVERYSQEKQQVEKRWQVFPHSIDDTAAWLALQDDDAAMLSAQALVQEVDMHNDTFSYIMAMYACDRSFIAARMAGFGAVDTIQNSGYIYKITLQGTDLYGEWKTGTESGIYYFQTLQATALNNKVTLSFPTKELNAEFSGYYFERARKRGSFERLNKIPVSIFGSDSAQTIFYYDTVPEYGVAYRYRVIGQDIFGVSDIVSQEVNVKCVEEVVINVDDSEIVIYKDSLPPVPPFLIDCVQDSNGVVLLEWEKSKSRDVEGYRVFRAYGSDIPANGIIENAMQITSKIISNTFLYDTLSKKVFRKTFYFVKAIDSVGNESIRSNIIAAENPLPNIPAPALILSCGVAGGKLVLKWVNSPDSDVSGHQIYLKKDSGVWHFAGDIPLYENMMYDVEDSVSFPLAEFASAGIYYFDVRAYTGRKTDYASAPFFCEYVVMPSKVIPTFEAIALRDKFCIVLQWKRKQIENLKKIYIYRRNAAIEQGFTLVKILLENNILQEAWNDKVLKIGNTYQYKIQLEFNNGSVSEYSKTVEVRY